MGNLLRAPSIVAVFLLCRASATAATAAPIAGLHYLVGQWKCTYRAGTAHLDYDATYAYDLGGRALREIASWVGGGDEEVVSYDARRHGWSAVVLDDQGNATIMHASGSDPNHFTYHSVYPDDTIAVTSDRISATVYKLHGTVRSGGKTIVSVDTCSRDSH